MRKLTCIVDNEGSPEYDARKIPGKRTVLSYLRSFEAVAWSGPYVRDWRTGETVKLPEMAAYTDGRWYWDSSDIYHFEKYDVRLNPEFLRMFGLAAG